MIDHFVILVTIVLAGAPCLLATSCDGALLDDEHLPDSAFTATSNSNMMEHPISGVNADHSAKTAR